MSAWWLLRITLYVMHVSTRARTFNQVLRPGGTPTARLPVTNQLFRIGCSGIKVDSPLCMHVSLSTAAPPASRTMAFFDLCNKVYTFAHNNSNIHTNNKKHACTAHFLCECTVIFFYVWLRITIISYGYIWISNVDDRGSVNDFRVYTHMSR